MSIAGRAQFARDRRGSAEPKTKARQDKGERQHTKQGEERAGDARHSSRGAAEKQRASRVVGSEGRESGWGGMGKRKRKNPLKARN